MPEFVNPFSGVVSRKMTKGELIRAIRLNIAAEHEAVHVYMAHAVSRRAIMTHIETGSASKPDPLETRAGGPIWGIQRPV